MSVRRAFVCSATVALLAASLAAPALLAAAVPGSGGVRLDGVLLPPERIWDEYRYQYCARAMIHARNTVEVDEKLLTTVVEQVLGAEMLAREAERRGHALSAAELKAVREAEVGRWRGEQQLATACKLLKVDEPFILARAARQRVIEAMAVKDSGAERGLDDQALEAAYLAHRGEYLTKELPPIRYLFVPAGPGVTNQTLKDIGAQGHELTKAGKSFVSLVERYSKHPSASAGGIVPEREENGPGLPFQPPRARLKECRFTGEANAEGLHFYFRDCRQPLPYAEVREKVRASEIAERRRRWTIELLAGIKQKAKVEYLTSDKPLVGPAEPAGGAHAK
jgi:hypothetical protein